MNQIRDTPAATLADWWQRYMERQESAGDYQLRIFVRSLRPPAGAHKTREQIFEMLRMATEEDCIGDFEVRVSGKEVCLCERCRELTPDNTVRDELLELAEWGEQDQTAIGFDQRYVNSSITDEAYQVLVPPETALGIYVDGSLTGVFPCTINGTRYSIELFLRSLVKGHLPVESSRTEGQARHLLS